jgi:hypothetical protein
MVFPLTKGTFGNLPRYGATNIPQSRSRILVREIEGSPTFRFTNSSLADGSQELFNFEDKNSETAKYLPFDEVVIQNLSSYPVVAYINQNTDDVIPIPANTIVKIDRNVWSLIIRNDSGSTISAGNITIACSRARMSADKGTYLIFRNEATQSPLTKFINWALPFTLFK